MALALLGVGLLAPRCASVQREQRTVLSVEGASVEAREVDYGCEGEVMRTQVHRQVGGRLAVDHREPDGWNLGASVELLHGKLESASGFEPAPERSPYSLAGVGSYLGFDWPHLGLELGVGAAGGPDGALGVWPWGVAWGGQHDVLRVEAVLGRRGGLLDGRLARLGMAVPAEPLTFDVGLALVSRPMLEQSPESNERFTWGSKDREFGDLSAYVAVRVVMPAGVGGFVKVVGGPASGVHVGLSLWTDSLAEPPAGD